MTEEGRRAYDLLRRYRHMLEREKEIRERIQRCRDSAMRATSQLSASRSSGSAERSRLESASVRALDLERQLQETLANASDQRLRIQAAINGIECVELRRVLELRYIDGEMWEYLNARMHISRTTSQRWHNMALEDFWANYSKSEHDGAY